LAEHTAQQTLDRLREIDGEMETVKTAFSDHQKTILVAKEQAEAASSDVQRSQSAITSIGEQIKTIREEAVSARDNAAAAAAKVESILARTATADAFLNAEDVVQKVAAALSTKLEALEALLKTGTEDLLDQIQEIDKRTAGISVNPEGEGLVLNAPVEFRRSIGVNGAVWVRERDNSLEIRAFDGFRNRNNGLIVFRNSDGRGIVRVPIAEISEQLQVTRN
jgi:chromosome segregation ATPase